MPFTIPRPRNLWQEDLAEGAYTDPALSLYCRARTIGVLLSFNCHYIYRHSRGYQEANTALITQAVIQRSDFAVQELAVYSASKSMTINCHFPGYLYLDESILLHFLKVASHQHYKEDVAVELG